MKKISLKPGEMLAPVPSVMVSCGDDKESNILTIAWTGIINSNPPMTYISVRPERHSHALIERNGQFVINLVSEDLVYEMDHCGSVSGAKENKFKAMHLTKIKAEKVACPMIEESPVNIECKIIGKKFLGSHDMYLAEIVAVHINEDLLEADGRIALEKANLVAYIHGQYHGLKEEELGRYGYSVMKEKTKARRRKEGKPVGGKEAHFHNEEIKQPEEKEANTMAETKKAVAKKAVAKAAVKKAAAKKAAPAAKKAVAKAAVAKKAAPAAKKAAAKKAVAKAAVAKKAAPAAKKAVAKAAVAKKAAPAAKKAVAKKAVAKKAAPAAKKAVAKKAVAKKAAPAAKKAVAKKAVAKKAAPAAKKAVAKKAVAKKAAPAAKKAVAKKAVAKKAATTAKKAAVKKAVAKKVAKK